MVWKNENVGRQPWTSNSKICGEELLLQWTAKRLQSLWTKSRMWYQKLSGEICKIWRCKRSKAVLVERWSALSLWFGVLHVSSTFFLHLKTSHQDYSCSVPVLSRITALLRYFDIHEYVHSLWHYYYNDACLILIIYYLSLCPWVLSNVSLN